MRNIKDRPAMAERRKASKRLKKLARKKIITINAVLFDLSYLIGIY